MTKIKNKKVHFINIAIEHITANIKEYIIVSAIFIVGIFSGVMFVNYSKPEQKEEMTSYINTYINKNKEVKSINKPEVLKNSIKDNTVLAAGLWFAGTTLIGIPIVFCVILFRGFCLGFTISAATYTMGITKGLCFVLISILLQNILFIPAILALGVSGMKLYKSVMKDKRKEKLKVEVLRHTAFSCMMLGALILSAIVKVNVSGGMLQNLIKYF